MFVSGDAIMHQKGEYFSLSRVVRSCYHLFISFGKDNPKQIFNYSLGVGVRIRYVGGVS